MSNNLNSLRWWRTALKLKQAGKDIPTVVAEDVPQRGFYRSRRKGGPYEPVSIWYVGDELFCFIGTERQEDAFARKVWTYISRQPITHEVYTAVADEGKPWPDIDPTVAEQQRTSVGGNNPPTDPAELLKEQIESATAGAERYKEIASDAEAATAQTLRSRLLELYNSADGEREKQKRPHLDAGVAIDAKWMPMVRSAKLFADAIRTALSVWETAKLRKQREEHEKAQAAYQAAQNEAKATGDLPEIAAPPPPVEKPQAIKGAAGRAASVRSRRVVVEITDLDALWHSMKGRKDVQAFLLQLAQKIVDDNQDVLGVKIETQANVR